ncbi:MAG: helix-turn-helix domain-containing protein [Chthoniobacter sp.]
MSPRKIFGQNLSRLRHAAGLTQEQLCERADIDRSYLQRIETGSSSPTVEVAQRLRRGLQCSWDTLMQGLE